MSVDAANKETYHSIRRGGNWEKLINNLEYIGEQRKNGKFASFGLNFVVQSKNVSEIGKFVELGKKLNADVIWFSGIQNWGTYEKEEFEQIDVRDKNGIKEEYKKYFQDPILKSKEVKISALLTGKDAHLYDGM